MEGRVVKSQLNRHTPFGAYRIRTGFRLFCGMVERAIYPSRAFHRFRYCLRALDHTLFDRVTGRISRDSRVFLCFPMAIHTRARAITV